jgi:hypothetical protein
LVHGPEKPSGGIEKRLWSIKFYHSPIVQDEDTVVV